jgi:hypothetical protein
MQIIILSIQEQTTSYLIIVTSQKLLLCDTTHARMFSPLVVGYKD